MFSNFLYFIVALIIYTTSEIFEQAEATNSLLFLNALLFLTGFAGICHLTFRNLQRYADRHPGENPDYLIQRKTFILSVLALILFAVDIYILEIRASLSDIALFSTLPTFEALVFISFFFLHLIIIWYFAFPLQRRHFTGALSRKDYILSNIVFSLPALIPWFCLSLTMDIIILIPYQPLKELLNSSAGEIGLLLIFLMVLIVWSPVLIKKMWQCHSFEQGDTRERIEKLCRKAELKYADILQWDMFGGKMITAGVMGVIGRFRYLLVTPALIKLLNEEELDAVVLHEIGHIKKFHILFYLLFFAGFMACNYIYIEPLMLFLYDVEPVYEAFSLIGMDKAAAHPLLVSISLIGIFLLYFRFAFGLFMRNFERQADLYAFESSQQARALISTFQKIAFYSRQSMNKPNWHHYSMGERIKFLKKCEADPSLAQTHHKKVRKMIIIFFILLTIVLVAGFSILQFPVSNFQSPACVPVSLYAEFSQLIVCSGAFFPVYFQEPEKHLHH
jgi:Zn-dependent protease with chaperone function